MAENKALASPNSSSSNRKKKRVKKARTDDADKSLPNLLITGTPGTGKSTLASKLADQVSGMTHLNAGAFAKEKGHLGKWDEEYGCHELEEDPLLDDLEDPIARGGLIVDHHVSDFFPERFFDAVFVVRTDNTRLHDHLTARGYTGKKMEENLQCEIFQTVLDEARDSYRDEIVHEVRGDDWDDLNQNIERIQQWVQAWKKDNHKG